MSSEATRRRHQLVRRDFVVDAPLQEAWDWLARIEAWPSWAKHVNRVSLWPRGTLMPLSRGTFHLTGGIRSTFRIEAYDPPRRWQWIGRFGTITVHSDHRFEPVDDDHTWLTWQIDATGPGSRTIGGLFASIYGRTLDRSISDLRTELRRQVLRHDRIGSLSAKTR